MAARKMARPAKVANGFGRALKSARTKLDINQPDAAKRCGVKRSTYYSWESGDRLPNPRDWPKIAARMCTTVSALHGVV